jgi:diacylglycerol kinase
MKRFIDSVKHACAGLAQAWKSQPNLRIHVGIAVLVMVAGMWCHITVIEWCVVLLVIGQVLASELFNTVAEELVNWIEPAYSERARRIKDVAAGATLITAIVAVVTGLLIFAPRLHALFY